MDFEDFLEPQVAAAAAVAAAIFSPTVRGWLRRGAVYGLAGALIAGDAVTSVAKGVGRGAQQATASAATAARRVPVTNDNAGDAADAHQPAHADQPEATAAPAEG